MSLRNLNRVFLAAAMMFLAVPVARSIEIETVPVGNPGNAADGRYGGYGRVAYEFKIGKYEVTAGRYTEFLNTVGATDPNGLYDAYMWSSEWGCKIKRTGSSGSYTYSVAADRANRPVNYVSWYDAARFSNWLTTGNTEMGVYEFNSDGSVDVFDHRTAAATLGRTVWFIPTEDEWYKAAYHKNDGATGNYWNYPTGTNNEPSNDLVNPDPGNNANFYQDDGTIDAPYYTTVVGEFENSESPYGTFDQGGNLWEWIETGIGFSQGLRGGEWAYASNYLHASSRTNYSPEYGSYAIGFRVASIPGSSLPGDLNDDGAVNSRDLDTVRAWWGVNVEPGRRDRGDGNGDGLVNSRDLDLVRSHWGAKLPGAVPEPVAFVLLAFGLGFVLVRRP